MPSTGHESGGARRRSEDARNTLDSARSEEAQIAARRDELGKHDAAAAIVQPARPGVAVRLYDSIESFRTAAATVYLRDPVAAVVELMILRKPPDSDLPPLLVTVSDRGALAGAAIQTPPFPLLCGGLPESAINDVVAEVAQSRPDLTGVRGPRAMAARFAETWCKRTGAVSRVSVEERLYRLDVLRPPGTVEGESRPASEDDTEILVDWHARFRVEAMGDAPVPVVTAQSIRTAQQAGDIFLLWLLNGEPVSMAGVRLPTEGVSAIGPVYTPTDKRGHGFGSAVTAAAAGRAYAAGAQDVVLFTDLANPISNTIYQRIGFRPVTDFTRIDFSQPV